MTRQTWWSWATVGWRCNEGRAKQNIIVVLAPKRREHKKSTATFDHNSTRPYKLEAPAHIYTATIRTSFLEYGVKRKKGFSKNWKSNLTGYTLLWHTLVWDYGTEVFLGVCSLFGRVGKFGTISGERVFRFVLLCRREAPWSGKCLFFRILLPKHANA